VGQATCGEASTIPPANPALFATVSNANLTRQKRDPKPQRREEQGGYPQSPFGSARAKVHPTQEPRGEELGGIVALTVRVKQDAMAVAWDEHRWNSTCRESEE
jgi:hypothetical protein